jgi:hypothetical protein
LGISFKAKERRQPQMLSEEPRVRKPTATGFRGPIRRSTLAGANETRDWRIYAEFAQRLIAQARRLYADDELEEDLASTVYALDSTTIDLCLSVFPADYTA